MAREMRDIVVDTFPTNTHEKGAFMPSCALPRERFQGNVDFIHSLFNRNRMAWGCVKARRTMLAVPNTKKQEG